MFLLSSGNTFAVLYCTGSKANETKLISCLCFSCVSSVYIFYSATILRSGHVRGVEARFSNLPWAGCAAKRWSLGPGALSRLFPKHYRDDNMDRASQVLAQGVPASVPKSYPCSCRSLQRPSFYTPSSSCSRTIIALKALSYRGHGRRVPSFWLFAVFVVPF